MKTLIKIFPLFLVFSLVFISSCDKKDCLDCNAAARHYHEALLSRYCDTNATQPAREKCQTACAIIGVYDMATRMESACNNNYSPRYEDCSGHR